MAEQLEPRISMLGQKAYEKAIKKYGEVFANAVVETELQLHADNLDCFDEYTKFDFMQALKEREVQK